MSTITVQDIEFDPKGFLGRVEAGEAFIVVRDQRRLAEVRPLPTAIAQPRPFGLCAGQFSVPDGFDQPLPDDILREFEWTMWCVAILCRSFQTPSALQERLSWCSFKRSIACLPAGATADHCVV
jgi:antitoxin (DNA-binding transcriptional repressor) of toxin-antitoxin stability system